MHRSKQNKSAAKQIPRWAVLIKRLRRRLGLSQAGLAKQLQCSSMSISRWERGINEPPAHCYVQLGKLAGKPDCWLFWERVNLSKDYVQSLL
jgi:DNA-binding transcriptional regulator YiaG